ncbi:MAG: serine hydrolase [Gemmatimonadaceae bacterium]|nr:serine hydrolase [Chitinophagaceae bacterium]
MRITATLFSFLIFFVASGQAPRFINDDGVTLSIHKKNIGRIIFTDQKIEPSNLRQSDMLKKYRLTNKSNLFITVFLGQSLTNHLHAIDTALMGDALTRRGNYQFRLLVDKKLVYESNLHPGAPYARIKNTETIISKPLIDHSNEGAWWSQSFWNRFMANGGDSSLTEENHLLRMEICTYVDSPVLRIGPIIAAGEMDIVVNRVPSIDLNTIRIDPIRPYDGFEISKEFFDTAKIKALKAYAEEGVFRNITSIVVLKNGKLAMEEYFNKSARPALHDVRSVGKSFASTMMGIAIADRFIKNENTMLSAYYDLDTFQNMSMVKKQTTLKQLLTMSSAFDGDDAIDSSPGNEENMYPSTNWVKFALDLPMDSAKYNNNWHYFTAGVVILGDILHRKVPGGLEAYASKKLFTPLGIKTVKWQYTPQGVVNTAGGIKMNALDFAKYGQLYKDQGRWQGQQLIPESWVAETFTKHISLPGRSNEYYGLLFWNKTFQVNGQSYEAFYCAGNGGNSIFIFRDLPLVIVITATAYGAGYAHTQVHRIVEQYVLPAFTLPQ